MAVALLPIEVVYRTRANIPYVRELRSRYGMAPVQESYEMAALA